MRKKWLILITAALLAALVASCSRGNAAFDVAAHRDEILEWRAGRLERLLSPYGFLTLSGLYWLEPGTYSFGSNSDNDVVFPASAAAVVGHFSVSEAGIEMQVVDGVEVLGDEFPVTSIHIDDDTTDTPVTITHNSLAWTVVKRDNRYAVRLRDFDNPAIIDFGELPYFNIDPEWRIAGTLNRYEEPRVVRVGTVIEGLGWNPESPGKVAFEYRGKAYEIEAYDSGDSLFFVFGDATNRDDTYGAGRFLYTANPGDDGAVVLDFNQSYSPPCAFNDFATCPVASPGNRLPIRIEAGEKFDAALYQGDAHGY